MFSLNLVLRGVTILLFGLRFGYWIWAESLAHSHIPKLSASSYGGVLRRAVSLSHVVLILFQLAGLAIFPLPHSDPVQVLGFLLVLAGMLISLVGRHQLGYNWTDAAEYQIKPRQALVTSGIYSYIRHPIYLGLVCSYIGAELVAESYLVLMLVIIYGCWVYWQITQEEALLLRQFGTKYQKYMYRTSHLIPAVW